MYAVEKTNAFNKIVFHYMQQKCQIQSKPGQSNKLTKITLYAHYYKDKKYHIIISVRVMIPFTKLLKKKKSKNRSVTNLMQLF